jgi:hypothetical protein
MVDGFTVFLLLSLFGIKHFICDFLLQTNYMVSQKGIYGARGGLQHALIHAFFTLAISYFFVTFFALAVLMAIFDGVVHYHIDWAKQQLARGLTVADKMFWVWFGTDQCLHYLTYVLIIGVLAGFF